MIIWLNGFIFMIRCSETSLVEITCYAENGEKNGDEWWPIVAKFNLNRPRYLKPYFKRYFKLYLNSFLRWRLSHCLHFKLIFETKLIYTFTWILFLICYPSWLVVSLIRFNLIKILLFWNGNLKSSSSDEPSWTIAAIVFCRTNINGSRSSAFAIKTHW